MTEKKATQMATEYFEIIEQQKKLVDRKEAISIDLIAFAQKNKTKTIGKALVYEKILAPKLIKRTKAGDKVSNLKEELLNTLPASFVKVSKVIDTKALFVNRDSSQVVKLLQKTQLKVIAEKKLYIKHI